MNIENTFIDEVKVLTPHIHSDERGFFMETFRSNIFKEKICDLDFVQENHSKSAKGVLRGLHFQTKQPQGKLVRCTLGSVYDVAVDIRPDSKTFGKYFGIELNETNKKMLWIPPGFAHGFCVLSNVADFQYKCTDYYDPNSETGLIWNDRDLNIDWPHANPSVSSKDRNFMTLREYFKDQF